MLTNRLATTALLVLSLLFSAPAAFAESATDLMQKRRDLSSGWNNTVTSVTMKITNAQGASVVRELKQYALEVSGAGNRTINVFLRPSDVDGVAVLTHSGLRGKDEQWLFLPTNGRVKRISSANRSGAFIGSEFAYEDLSSFEVGKYAYADVSEGDDNGSGVFVVDSKPSYANSGYSSLRTYLNKKNYQPTKVEFFNKRGELYKTLTLGKYKSYGGAWRPHSLDMLNHLTGKRTSLAFGAYQPSPVGADAFNSNRLNNVK